MHPLVSIIIPAFNAAQHIRETLNSALSQTWSPIEIVVINDGSTDDTEEVIKSFNDERIKYHRQPNSGQCVASNQGIKKSAGKYIKFLDADDLMNSEHIEAQMQMLFDRENAVSFCAWGRFEQDTEEATFRNEPYCVSGKPLEWLKLSMGCKYDMMPGWFWLIPRTLLEKSGGWDERLSLNNDFEFSIRLLLHASYVVFTPNAKMYYRSYRKESLSNQISRTAYQAAILSTRIACAQLMQHENSVQVRLLCANKFAYWLFQIYPRFPELTIELEKEIELLGGSNRKLDESKLMHAFQQLLGWKIAKRLKRLIYFFGYKKYILKAD